MRYLSLTALLLLGLAASAATVTTDTSCLIGNVGAVSGLPTCSITAPSGARAQAGATASFTLGATTVSTNAEVSVLGSSTLALKNGSLIGNTASVESQFAMNADLYTAGPVRAGFIAVSKTDGWLLDELGGTNGSLNWSLGSVSGGCSGAGFYESCTGLTNYTLPFTLGTAFQLTESAVLRVSPDPVVEVYGTGDGSLKLQFQFFEADGVTPVQVLEAPAVPEPHSLALMAAGLLGLLMMQGRSQRNSLRD